MASTGPAPTPAISAPTPVPARGDQHLQPGAAGSSPLERGRLSPGVARPPRKNSPARARSPFGRKDKDLRIRVGNFNVENLVKENTVYYDRNSYTADEVARKVEWIAHQLRKMDVGICGFQEVFSEEPLRKACELSGQFKGGEVVTFGADGHGPTVALASVYPVLEKHSIADFPAASLLHFEGATLPVKKFSRPVLRAVIMLPSGDQCTVFVAHMKSKRPVVDNALRHDQKAKAVGHALSLVIRAAEAAALRCLLVDEMEHNHRPVILCGDLNDVVHSVTTEILAGTPPWKRLPMEQKEQIWDSLLWSTNEVQVRSSDRDVTYSHIHNGRYEVLDHVFVSQEFNRQNPGHLGYVMMLQIFNDHLVDETLSDDPRDVTHSDHGQVVAVIRLYPRTEPKHLAELQASGQPTESTPGNVSRPSGAYHPPAAGGAAGTGSPAHGAHHAHGAWHPRPHAAGSPHPPAAAPAPATPKH